MRCINIYYVHWNLDWTSRQDITMLYIYNFFTFYYFRNKNNYLFLSFSVFYRGLYLLVYCKITNNQLILNHIRIKFIGYAIFLLITKIILYIYKIFLNLQKHFVTCKILLPLFFSTKNVFSVLFVMLTVQSAF